MPLWSFTGPTELTRPGAHPRPTARPGTARASRAAAALATQGIACQIADGEGGVNFLSGLFGSSSTTVQVAQPAPVAPVRATPVVARQTAPAVRAQRTGTNGYHWEVFGGWTRD